MFVETSSTRKIASLGKRIRAIQGGTSASKTISVLLYLIALAQSDKKPTLTSIVSESLPHLKRGSMRDFLTILETHKYYRDERWNKSDFTYTFETGSKIEFFSVDQPSKVRGPRRDRLFINEANNVPFESFEQLEVRTKEFVMLDWNPTNEFWFYTEVRDKRTDFEHLIVTYKDNEALDKAIVDSIEQRMNRKGWWRVYGEGQLGEVEGKIYKDWVILDELPQQARLERRGLDFGYTNDPTAIVSIYYWNGGYVLDENVYQLGMRNKQIADTLKVLDDTLTVADSAEPKSIDEIRLYGVNIQPAEKGQGSVAQGIQYIQDQKIFITKRSVNLIKEYRNYLWKTDKDGKILNVPEGGNDHCFAPETLIHTTKGKKRIDELVGKEGYLYSRDGKIEKFYNVRKTRTNTEVISLTFNDGNVLTVTPNHLLLKPNGQWIEAQLLNTLDMIQSGIYGRTSIQWEKISFVSWSKILQSCQQEIASCCMAILQWGNSYRYAYSSQGQQQKKQSYFKPRIKGSTLAPFRTYYSGTTRETEEVGRDNKTSYKEMAWVKRGNSVAQVTWEESVCKPKTFRERVCSLSYKIYNYAVCKVSTFLWPELQDESETKTVVRISRGFCNETYNLEVENTHCLLANGVIAHNCMDAIRYAFQSNVTIVTNKEADFNLYAGNFK